METGGTRWLSLNSVCHMEPDATLRQENAMRRSLVGKGSTGEGDNINFYNRTYLAAPICRKKTCLTFEVTQTLLDFHLDCEESTFGLFLLR